MNESWEGFAGRIQRLNPLFELGRGMEVGDLKPHIQTILMQVLLNIFYSELNDDDNRRKSDIKYMVEEAIKQMKLLADDKQIDRITSGLLYQGKEEYSKPFEALYYDEIRQSWETQTFRYVTMDELYTNLEMGGTIVYKLTDVAQEMIFMSREMAEEFSITIEQLYSMQLIKNGNFRKATRNLDHLISRVNRLMSGEYTFQKEMINNPKVLLIEEERQRADNREEIERQFDEEKAHFRTISSMIEKTKRRNEEDDHIQQELFILQEKIGHTRQLHDRFAKLVIQNISYEMKLKAENPSLFWENSLVSFREHIYENWLMKEGVQSFDDVESILSPLFSPKNEFILPMDWIWGEQELVENQMIDTVLEEEAEENLIPMRVTNWESVITAWSYVFQYLQTYGEFSLTDLNTLPLEIQDLWFEESETLDLWMMFDKKPLKVQVLHRNEETLSDEREILLYKLMNEYPQFQVFEGSKLFTKFDHLAEPFIWYNTKITPFKICVQEEKG
ncbi:DNA polymerase III delta prime subunit [Cytobacillus purgationiresistens]|uniref:DNA polymerase III delta prime subunit n=1 Tax=Cytobacillus purgationiresistens TaxID=863449 RepID=A0ABU0ABG1_9BACI|nr:DNA polymerase III delta prime subunit [Cytobacillus purgationiresistens]